jgi:release factor glutamine methyltransferase
MTAGETATFGAALERGARSLDGELRGDAALLMAFASGRSRAWLLAHAGDAIDARAVERFEALCARRGAGVPIAYLTGSAWFCGREFAVDERVLIPRPETEHLVEDAVRVLRGRADVRALDVGTGSGAIACTLAAELPAARVDATDLSAAALDVARANARRLDVAGRVSFFEGDLTAPLDGRAYDVVVANLPYVPSADVAPRPNPVSYEPRGALDGGPDGLAVYRRLVPELPAALRPGGVALLEAAPPTMDALLGLVSAAFPSGWTTVERDYGGRGRYVKVAASD